MYSMIRILHTESSLGWGGQEIRILKEIKGISERGYWVALAAPIDSMIYKKAKEEKILTFPLELQKRNPFLFVKLWRIINQFSISIINTHSSRDSWHAVILKLISPNSNIRLIRTRHLSTPISKNFLSKLVYSLPDVVITTGEAIRQQMINYNKFNPNKIISIPTGVDLSIFSPEYISPTIKKEGFFLVGTISILRSWKGHRYFLEAIPEVVKTIKNVKFLIVGDGPQKANLEELVQKLGLKKYVTFLGYREDIPAILASLDLLVHPSTGHEGVPQIILQALAMKKPVIATNVGSIPEIIKNNYTGLLIKPASSTQLAEAIIFLLQNRELAHSLGEKGRKLVESRYSFSRMLDKIEEIYQKFTL